MTPHPVVVLYAHPDGRRSTANRRLIEAVVDLPDVTIHDLYERYPDYDIDRPVEQAAVQKSALVILQYPTQWYSLPPLLKLWIDTVLTPGWAYDAGGTALQGKHFWCVTTTGGDQTRYVQGNLHGYPYDAFLPPLIQTARLCGMIWLPPWVIHGVPHFDDERLGEWAACYRERLATYPAWVADSV
ncbi:MAG: NAD(P)H-dependent oxidoreductase [Gammaproteobacteria bacterium]|nr:NAD(P)H-dependent oxidoreductase [Gammaproteobacteria bacterium]